MIKCSQCGLSFNVSVATKHIVIASINGRIPQTAGTAIENGLYSCCQGMKSFMKTNFAAFTQIIGTFGIN